MKKSAIISLAVILLSFIIGFSARHCAPEQMASHWNLKGEVDGYIPKFWGLYLMPIVSLVLFLFFIFIPQIDPLKANIEKFRKYFDNFIVLIIIFLFYIHTLTILWNLGLRFNMGQFLTPALGLLFFYAGVLVENAKRNYFIGIRTPWTLNSDKVWEKTHKLGGKLFKIAGIIAILGVFIPDYAFFLVIIPAIFAVTYSIIYSYIEFKKEKNS